MGNLHPVNLVSYLESISDGLCAHAILGVHGTEGLFIHSCKYLLAKFLLQFYSEPCFPLRKPINLQDSELSSPSSPNSDFRYWRYVWDYDDTLLNLDSKISRSHARPMLPRVITLYRNQPNEPYGFTLRHVVVHPPPAVLPDVHEVDDLKGPGHSGWSIC